MSQEEKIVEYLKVNNKINRNIVEKLLGISSTRAKIILKNMINNNIIKSMNNGKNTYYVLKKSDWFYILNYQRVVDNFPDGTRLIIVWTYMYT